MSSGSVSSWLSSRSSVWTRQRCVATCRVVSWLLASEISLKSNMCSVWYRRVSSCVDIHTREDKEKNSHFESVFRISVQSGHWFCKNWKFNKTGTSPHGISEVGILVDQHIAKNCLIHAQFYSFKDSTKGIYKSLQFRNSLLTVFSRKLEWPLCTLIVQAVVCKTCFA